jgi:hypothetical protein
MKRSASARPIVLFLLLDLRVGKGGLMSNVYIVSYCRKNKKHDLERETLIVLLAKGEDGEPGGGRGNGYEKAVTPETLCFRSGTFP